MGEELGGSVISTSIMTVSSTLSACRGSQSSRAGAGDGEVVGRGEVGGEVPRSVEAERAVVGGEVAGVG